MPAKYPAIGSNDNLCSMAEMRHTVIVCALAGLNQKGRAINMHAP